MQGVTVDEDRVGAVTRLADKLITQGRTDVDFVKDKRDSLVTKSVNANIYNSIQIVFKM